MYLVYLSEICVFWLSVTSSMFESSSSSNTLQVDYPYILKKNNTENLEFMCLNSPFLETATYQFCQQKYLSRTFTSKTKVCDILSLIPHTQNLAFRVHFERFHTHIGVVMVSARASSVVYRGFKPKTMKFGMCCFIAHSCKE